MKESMIKLRMSMQDVHYGGNLVTGAKMLALFGFVVTELLIMNDGDEGLFVAKKINSPRTDISPLAADVLEEPIVVCRASGTCVVPKSNQRD